MTIIERYQLPISLDNKRRSRYRPVMATSLGYYEKSIWTDWADKHLLKSTKIFEMIKGTNYEFWLEHFSDWIRSTTNANVDPLLMHVPLVEKEIGMKPIWAMSFSKKGIFNCPEGVPWSPKISNTNLPAYCKESMNLVGIKCASEEFGFRLERECFPSLSTPLKDLKPVFVERMYNPDHKLVVFSVLSSLKDQKWLLRCGNQNNLTDSWNTDFQLDLPELNHDLLIQDEFPKATKRLLRLRWPLVYEVNDPNAIKKRGYDTKKLDG